MCVAELSNINFTLQVTIISILNKTWRDKEASYNPNVYIW